ncbi:MAG: adenylate/guanylate cyclase domain-containing protein [Candidatus Synoicihabitans palmerolidicus]|nr:adenylate/guanylate cyclase domain-containing protein [Candidatus Synoicihabitans palmerolidicus]
MTSTDIYESDVGFWISGYAPIRNSAGTTVAVLEVDAQVQRYDRALREKLLIEALVTAFALTIALMAVMFLTRQLTWGIERLALAMKRFERGEENVQLTLDSKDEISAMAETFSSMVFSVGERLKLLPFVSQFTARAVEKSRFVENWLEGQEQEVAVLMTAVRGFTRSAEDMAPDELLRRLNMLLSLQSKVVIAHGGDVDQFMGDAVLAVFTGHPDNLARAVRCAREILSRVQRQTDAWPQNRALGAAVNYGRVVVGAVRSQARRDYTVIGNPVNVAAHLCAAAKPWELLLPPQWREALPADLQADFPEEVPVRTKHEETASPMRSHRRTKITQTAMVAKRMGRSGRIHWVGLVGLVGYAVLAWKAETMEARPWLALALGTGWVTLGWVGWRQADSPAARRAVVMWAVLLRLVGVGTTPSWEDDYYRYLWDGYQTVVTGNPYATAPAMAFGDPEVPEVMAAVLDGINHPEVPTIYGPLPQGVFAVAAWMRPGSLVLLQVLLVLIELAGWWSLRRVVGWGGWVLVWWCPLAVTEIAFTGHPEGSRRGGVGGGVGGVAARGGH